MDGRFCANCGVSVDPEDIFCEKCGADQREPGELYQTTVGSNVPGGERVDVPIAPPVPPYPTNIRKKSRARSFFKIAAITLLVVLLVGGGTFAGYKGYRYLMSLRSRVTIEPPVVRVVGEIPPDLNSASRPGASYLWSPEDSRGYSEIDVKASGGLLDGVMGVVTEDSVNFRAGHDLDARVLRKMNAGDVVKVSRRFGAAGEGYWYNVDFGGENGWIYGQYLRIGE